MREAREPLLEENPGIIHSHPDSRAKIKLRVGYSAPPPHGREAAAHALVSGRRGREPGMPYTLSFEDRHDYLYVSVTGDNTYDTINRYLSEVHDLCVRLKRLNLLVVENLSGPSLSTMSIFDLVTSRSLQTARDIGRIAYVDANPDHDARNLAFAENVAVNRNVNIRIFSTVAAAEEWLLSHLYKKRSRR
jgi:hypothetical protein